MTREQFNLMSFLEGYVRNYRKLNLHQATNRSMFTKREIDYFANLGEMLGLFSFVEDTKPNLDYGRSRPMDLSWWKWDERIDKENYLYVVLHLERENLSRKDIETIDKLFCATEEYYLPHYVIGIQNVETKERINYLNKLVEERNLKQGSEVLMIYRYYDEVNSLDRIEAYHFNELSKIINNRNAISIVDNTGYWCMAFEEEYETWK
ncbi:hypothetical protein [Paenibacillus beijingensis]|uniref:Uncharacterized protein n=1 Tax=Paenibacillus beijingensis TaxID=1126833 RepID=A0A0D5NNL6_9BACL|nr:hypothetical protein [Paenibacillus beijingensis]AJY76735.1 hypothetical protein VN24_21905 [Paenibacillus beijingensis]